MSGVAGADHEAQSCEADLVEVMVRMNPADYAASASTKLDAQVAIHQAIAGYRIPAELEQAYEGAFLGAVLAMRIPQLGDVRFQCLRCPAAFARRLCEVARLAAADSKKEVYSAAGAEYSKHIFPDIDFALGGYTSAGIINDVLRDAAVNLLVRSVAGEPDWPSRIAMCEEMYLVRAVGRPARPGILGALRGIAAVATLDAAGYGNAPGDLTQVGNILKALVRHFSP